MRITCLGAENQKNQVHHLRTTFQVLGHEIVDFRQADLIFCNDPSVYSEDFRKNNKGATIIYNVLDYPPHLIDPKKYDVSKYTVINHPWPRNFDVEGLTNKLKQADIITTICDEVTWQVKHFSGLEAKTIYNPIKPISPLNLQFFQKNRNKKDEPYKYLAVGRLQDYNKRSSLIVSTLSLMQESPDTLVTAGSESLYYGEHLGELSDENLNILFNSVRYLFLLSSFKSIGLPALEAICAGIIPVVANDDPCTNEFFPGIGVPPNPYGIRDCLNSPDWNRKARQFVDENSEKYRTKFSPEQICKNILALIE